MKHYLSKRLISVFTSMAIISSVFLSFNAEPVITTYATAPEMERAINWAIKIAEAPAHGYNISSGYREGPDYDCSSLVAYALKGAGIYDGYAFSTEDMPKILPKYGFKYITGTNDLQRGDILWCHYEGGDQHTEIYLGDNKTVGAHDDYDGVEGDSSGKEIDVREYSNWCNYQGVFRYKPEDYSSSPSNVVLSKNQFWYDIKDTIELTASSKGAYTYYISVLKNGNSVVNQEMPTGELSISASKLGYGDFHTWVSAVNDKGSIDSNHLDFSIVPAPSYSKVYTARDNYSIDDTVIIGADAVCCKGQVIGIDKEGGSRIVTEDCSNPFRISAKSLGKGNYSAYFSIYNGSGTTDTTRVSFSIYDTAPKKSIITINDFKANYTVGDTITFQASSDLATDYWLGLDKNGKRYVTAEMKNGKYTIKLTEAGSYSAYVSASNELGYIDSEAVKFSVHSPIIVTFNPNGGICSKESKTIKNGDKYGELPTPTRTGYIFNGWYTAKDSGTLIKDASVCTATENHSLYAHWSAIPVTTATTTTTTSQTTTTTKATTTTSSTTKTTTTTTSQTTTTTKATTTTSSTTKATTTVYTTSTTDTTISTATSSSTTTESTTTASATTSLIVTSISLRNGEQYTIPINTDRLSFKSNNTDVAVVSPKGIITAVGVGEAVISIIYEDYNVIQLNVQVGAVTTTSTTTVSTSEETISTTTETTPIHPVDTELGDVNENGKVDAKDASMVLVAYAKMSTGGEDGFIEKQRKAADVNDDNKVDAKDASAILAYYALVSTASGDIPTMKEFMISKTSK